jgi:ParB-like chromosome segregation protein Spo0J
MKAPKPKSLKDIKLHPAADLFPDYSDEAYAELREDIRENGLREKILPLTADGRFLADGKHRLKVCIELGIEPKLVPQSQLNDEQKIISFVMSKKLHRRHLTVNQRADLGLAALPLYEAAAKERQRAAGGDRKSAEAKSGDRSPSKEGDRSGEAIRQAAKDVKVGHATLAKKKVIREKGSKQLKADVKAERITINAAYRMIRDSERPPPLPPDDSELAFTRNVQTKLFKGVEVISVVCAGIDGFTVDSERAKFASDVAGKLSEYAAVLRRWAKPKVQVVK